MITNLFAECFVDYSEKGTANFIFESLETLDSLINECRDELKNSLTVNSVSVYDFVEFANNLFEQYIFLKKYYTEEIPLFTHAYNNSLNLAYELIKKDFISKKRISSLLKVSKDVLKINDYYMSSTKKLIKKLKNY